MELRAGQGGHRGRWCCWRQEINMAPAAAATAGARDGGQPMSCFGQFEPRLVIVLNMEGFLSFAKPLLGCISSSLIWQMSWRSTRSWWSCWPQETSIFYCGHWRGTPAYSLLPIDLPTRPLAAQLLENHQDNTCIVSCQLVTCQPVNLPTCQSVNPSSQVFTDNSLTVNLSTYCRSYH